MTSAVTVLLSNGHQLRLENTSLEAWERAMQRGATTHEHCPEAMNFLGVPGQAMVRYDDIVAYWKS